MGWSEAHSLWRVPKWKFNVYMHCHLFEEGAKVMTRKSNERLAKAVEKMVEALCQATLQ